MQDVHGRSLEERRLMKLSIAAIVLSVLMIVFLFGYLIYNICSIEEPSYCDCTISWNGQQILIEDAIEGILEGLSVDQADDVRAIINGSD